MFRSPRDIDIPEPTWKGCGQKNEASIQIVNDRELGSASPDKQNPMRAGDVDDL